jgi:hypothetical protein
MRDSDEKPRFINAFVLLFQRVAEEYQAACVVDFLLWLWRFTELTDVDEIKFIKFSK